MRNVLTLALLIPHLAIGPSVALASTADAHTCLARSRQQLRRSDSPSREATAIAAAPPGGYSSGCPRFTRDLERLRQGITDYRPPSRAQPRDPVELSGHYRREPPEAQP